jgi:REP element-mobilizing transposase RayT
MTARRIALGLVILAFGDLTAYAVYHHGYLAFFDFQAMNAIQLQIFVDLLIALAFVVKRHGGARAGAGRRRATTRRNVPHRPRDRHHPHHPVHVTLRAALPASLRTERVLPTVQRALRAASHPGFRLLEFSIQPDHLHLIVEGDSGHALTRGIQGLAIRVAKAVNRVLHRRGRVWADRHHSRPLRTPREVRNALAYVLTNWIKHVRNAWGLDPASSARWFRGWTTSPAPPESPSPVVPPRSWLAGSAGDTTGSSIPGNAPARAVADRGAHSAPPRGASESAFSRSRCPPIANGGQEDDSPRRHATHQASTGACPTSAPR